MLNAPVVSPSVSGTTTGPYDPLDLDRAVHNSQAPDLGVS